MRATLRIWHLEYLFRTDTKKLTAIEVAVRREVEVHVLSGMPCPVHVDDAITRNKVKRISSSR